MKYLFLIVLAVMLSCKGTSEKTENSEQPIIEETAANLNIKSIKLSVEGMTCTGCENTIETSVASLEGVSAVNASHVNGETHVEYDPEVTDTTAIKNKVIESGYAVNKIVAD